MNFSPSLADVLQSAERLIVSAIAEDIGSGDATTLSVIPPALKVKAVIMAKAEGIVAGLPVVKAVYAKGDSRVTFTPAMQDGTRVKVSDVIANLEGLGVSILSYERIALNFLQRLSGIATYTSAFVRAVQGTRAVILDTRKTTPGYRALEKYAVRIGGAQNHRHGLFDMILIKDNHIHAAGSISLAVRRARECYPSLPLEVEVKSLEELKETLSLPVDFILLDNMDLTTIRQSVALVNNRVPLEASGGVRIENVHDIAATGVNYISIGALTHSAPALDISLDLVG
jgi:nicotinate-nucleotide pyrophosphorylase (carboxylating)